MLLILCILPSLADETVNVFHVTGHVLQKVENGYLVESTPRSSGVSGVSFSGGTGQYTSGVSTSNGITQFIPAGTVLVVSKQDLVDGDGVEMNIIYAGTFSYVNTLGAQATVRKTKAVA